MNAQKKVGFEFSANLKRSSKSYGFDLSLSLVLVSWTVRHYS